MLSHRQALLAIRRVFRKPGAMFGMCYQNSQLLRRGKISGITSVQVTNSIESMKPVGAGYWYWPFNKTGAKERVKAITKLLKKLK